MSLNQEKDVRVKSPYIFLFYVYNADICRVYIQPFIFIFQADLTSNTAVRKHKTITHRLEKYNLPLEKATYRYFVDFLKKAIV